MSERKYRCHGGCGKKINESEVVWADEDGVLTVMDGYPWCDECLPMPPDDDFPYLNEHGS